MTTNALMELAEEYADLKFRLGAGKWTYEERIALAKECDAKRDQLRTAAAEGGEPSCWRVLWPSGRYSPWNDGSPDDNERHLSKQMDATFELAYLHPPTDSGAGRDGVVACWRSQWPSGELGSWADGDIEPEAQKHLESRGIVVVRAYASPPADSWTRVEDGLPDGEEIVLVYTPDTGDGERIDFDWRYEGCWHEHEEAHQHYMMVGGPMAAGPDAVCTGPGQDAPYTHWKRIDRPAIAGAAGEA